MRMARNEQPIGLLSRGRHQPGVGETALRRFPAMSRVLRAFFALSLVAPAALCAQSASATAKAFFQAQTAKQWLAMADFVDTTSLRVLRGIADTQVQGMTTMAMPATRARMDSMGASGALKASDAVQAMLGPGSTLRYTFARVTGAAELQAMSDRELMARWFEAKSVASLFGLSGGMMKQMMAMMPQSSSGETQSMLDRAESSSTSWEIVGVISEGDSLAHVAYRVAGITPPAPTAILT